MRIEKGGGHESPSVDELMLFLSRYSARLLGAGATCIRLEKNVGRIAKAYGMEAVSYTHLTLPTNSLV